MIHEIIKILYGDGFNQVQISDVHNWSPKFHQSNILEISFFHQLINLHINLIGSKFQCKLIPHRYEFITKDKWYVAQYPVIIVPVRVLVITIESNYSCDKYDGKTNQNYR